MRPKICL